MLMAAEAFLYDQIALVGVACVLLVTALSQLRLGWKEPQFLRYWLRRIAAAEAVLVTLWSADPHVMIDDQQVATDRCVHRVSMESTRRWSTG